jgi:hypothetical protein
MTVSANETLPLVEQKPAPKTKTAKQVAIREQQAQVVAAVAPTTLLDVILRAGSDPNFDVEKFRSLVAIQREEQDRQDARTERQAEIEAEAAFNAAMADVQEKMVRVKATLTNISTHSVYADYAAMDRMLRPLYSKAGFGLTYGEEDSPKPEHVRVFCLVTHVPRDEGGKAASRGFTRKYHVDMPADGKGAKGGDVMTKTHAAGSAFTYGQRYLLKMIFNIAVSRDDDGNAAGDTDAATITALQLQELEKLAEEVNANVDLACKHLRIGSLAELPVAQFDRVKQSMEAKRTPL